MNNDQIGSFVRLILNLLAGIFAAHGMKDTVSLINAPDTAALGIVIVTFLWSHFFVHADPIAGSGAGGSKFGLLLAVTLPALMLTGCASAPTNAYKAVGTTDITVSAAMTAWGDYVAQKHPPVSEERAVKAAFEKFQAAELPAVDAITVWANVSETNSAAFAASGTRAEQLSKTANQAFADLLALIQKFGVKL